MFQQWKNDKKNVDSKHVFILGLLPVAVELLLHE